MPWRGCDEGEAGSMTKQELIAECYQALDLDPDKNPESLEQITEFSSQDIDQLIQIARLMGKYIDQEEG